MFGKKKVQKKESQNSTHLISDSAYFGYIEAYKALRTNLIYMTESGAATAKTIMVTSSVPNEGKTTVAINLATSLAQDGKKVILVDCDLRKGTLSRHMHLSKQELGLSAILAGQGSESGKISESFRHWSKGGIDIFPAGYVPNNPSELLGSDRMRVILKALSKYYDYIICDSAPVTAVTDSLALGRYIDGAVFVVAQDIATKETVRSVKEQLESVNVQILGVVFNKYDAKKTGSKAAHEYIYYSSYGNGYGKAPEVTDGKTESGS